MLWIRGRNFNLNFHLINNVESFELDLERERAGVSERLQWQHFTLFSFRLAATFLLFRREFQIMSLPGVINLAESWSNWIIFFSLLLRSGPRHAAKFTQLDIVAFSFRNFPARKIKLGKGQNVIEVIILLLPSWRFVYFLNPQKWKSRLLRT